MEKSQRELLLLEYEIVHDGYKSRDELVPREFAYMLQAFAIFLTIVGAAKAFIEFDRTFAIVVFLLLGIAGLISLIAYLIDIQANTSCKRALRSRATNIENQLGTEHLKYWRTIREREMFFEEDLLKRTSGGGIMRSAATGFVWSARLLVVFWIILIVLIVACGETIKIG